MRVQQIKAFLSRRHPNLLGMWRVYTHLLRNKRSFLYTSGWYESARRDYPCLQNGDPVPWMNYAMISFLRSRLTARMRLLEFGSGYSTLFFASLVADLVSVESDEHWYNLIKEKLPHNVKLKYVPEDTDGDYCRAGHAELGDGAFDVVVVDGKDRTNCIRQSVELLSESGVIVLDDSHRSAYADGIEFAKNRGFRSIEFEGVKQYGGRNSGTTLFYRSRNCFGI